jgi:putative ABC transport system permease protein
MNKLVIANLLHRPLRSLISVTAVAIEVVMILSIVAIFMGMLDSQKERTNGIGADVVVMPSNASMIAGVGGAPMTAKLLPGRSAPCKGGSACDHRFQYVERRRNPLWD